MKKNVPYFISECFFDTVLVKKLLKNDKAVWHVTGCSKVAKVMEMRDDFVVGIIDEDKRKIKYLSEFLIVCDTGSLKLFRHRETSIAKYFIQLCPALEIWMLNVFSEGAIDFKAMGIPATLEELKDVTKHESISDVDALALCKPLLGGACAETHSIRTLKRWLTHFHEHGRNANLDTLKTISD
jgi:hypothetical protein